MLGWRVLLRPLGHAGSVCLTGGHGEQMPLNRWDAQREEFTPVRLSD